MSEVQRRAEAMMAEHGFQGVPSGTFEQAGRQQFVAFLREGLRPESRVVEFGCGCLRIAYWLVRFLEPGGYCGIEPATRRVELGKQYLFSPEELAHKAPRFDDNEVFDTSVFGGRFDFFLGRSIWTHASKGQIEATLDSFVRDATDAGVFLTSYLPAAGPEDDYQGATWVGTSHLSDEPGVIRHAHQWIEEQCRRRGLQVEAAGGPDCDSQYWLRVHRMGPPGSETGARSLPGYQGGAAAPAPGVRPGPRVQSSRTSVSSKRAAGGVSWSQRCW